jgi:MFS family permease
VLSALTAAMAIASYLGGRWTERAWAKPPVMVGVAMSAAAYAWMGTTWTADTSYPLFALQLGMLGAGFGLTVAPTTSAVVDHAPADQRGAAAGVVMVVRLLGLSVGLSALTAWGLARFEALRSTIDLPPLTDPGFESALLDAQQTLTAQAIAETFTAAAVVVGTGLLATFAMRRVSRTSGDTTMVHAHDPHVDTGTTHGDGDSDGDGDDAIATDAFGTVPQRTAASTVAVDRDVLDSFGRLQRRLNVMIGLLGLLLAGAFVTIFVLFGRVADAQSDASAARTELGTARADLERVEAGAALYASQIQGFQEQLVALEPEISAGVEEAIAGLRTFGDSTISFDVNIDEVIPIDTEVVIQRTVQVPIKTTIPIQQSFDTTIRVDTPLGAIPLDVNVPIDVEVPIDLVVDIPIDERVPIQDEFPVQLDVPIAINVGDTALAELTDSLAAGLQSLQDMLSGLSG